MSNKKNMCDECTTSNPHCDSVTCTVSVIYKKLKLYDEMVGVITSIQSGILPYEDESGVIKVSLHYWRNLKSILERAKKIQEAG